ncbi:MliC family protein [Sandaracinobacteroides hominis]|uniref:MliC family protein n=1 Tax=Sandaracinobacteroides hominis TaxID=2780086 RepID=UPI0018F2BCF7|nr:MliC family protein [Sandaracinobacteroides hominis]
MRASLPLLALCGLLAACKPAEKPADPAAPAETTAPVTPAAEAAMPAAPEIPPDRSTPAQLAEAKAAAEKIGMAEPTRVSRGTWTCDNDEKIELRFFPDQGIAVLVRGGQNLEMQSVPTASGFKYQSGPTTIQGKGEELQMNVGMMATAKCKLD